jgi:hypothetical protein
MKDLKTYTHYEQIIIDSIALDAYDIEAVDLFTDIKEVYNIFLSEYGFFIDRVGKKTAFKDWLQGLPSVMTVPFYNYEIIDNGKKEGFDLSSVDKEDLFLELYWMNLSQAFFTLKNNL